MRELVIVGLGNVGRKYEWTRHNAGYLIVSAFAKRLELSFKEEKRFFAFVASGIRGDVKLHLLLPTTYMNESGKSVAAFLNFYELRNEDLLVVVDDVYLPFGRFRLRLKGSSGGHNGLKSIAFALKTEQFPRLRVGIGRLEEPIGILTDFVLDLFTEEERKEFPALTVRGNELLNRALHEPLEKIMNEANI